MAEQAWQFDAQWFSALVKCHRHAPDRSGYNPRFAARSETVGSSRGRTCGRGHFSRVDSPPRRRPPCRINFHTIRYERPRALTGIDDRFRHRSKLKGTREPLCCVVPDQRVRARNVLRTQRVSTCKFGRDTTLSIFIYLRLYIFLSCSNHHARLREREIGTGRNEAGHAREREREKERE